MINFTLTEKINNLKNIRNKNSVRQFALTHVNFEMEIAVSGDLGTSAGNQDNFENSSFSRKI